MKEKNIVDRWINQVMLSLIPVVILIGIHLLEKR